MAATPTEVAVGQVAAGRMAVAGASVVHDGAGLPQQPRALAHCVQRLHAAVRSATARHQAGSNGQAQCSAARPEGEERADLQQLLCLFHVSAVNARCRRQLGLPGQPVHRAAGGYWARPMLWAACSWLHCQPRKTAGLTRSRQQRGRQGVQGRASGTGCGVIAGEGGGGLLLAGPLSSAISDISRLYAHNLVSI